MSKIHLRQTCPFEKRTHKTKTSALYKRCKYKALQKPIISSIYLPMPVQFSVIQTYHLPIYIDLCELPWNLAWCGLCWASCKQLNSSYSQPFPNLKADTSNYNKYMNFHKKTCLLLIQFSRYSSAGGQLQNLTLGNIPALIMCKNRAKTKNIFQ